MTSSDNFFINYGVRLLKIRAQPAILFYRLTCLWGLLLLLPFNTFNNPGFAVMRNYATEPIWGSIIFLIGVRLRTAQLSGRTKEIRDALFGTMILWSFITVMIISANTQGTGLVTYPLITYYIIREYLIYSVRYSVLKQETEEPNVSN
jgi:hypothetical protein